MTDRTRIAIGCAATNILLFALLFSLQLQKEPSSAEALAQSWGMYFFQFLIGMVVLNALVTIAITLRARARGGKGFDEVVDERDAFIERRVLRNLALVFVFGFFAAMGALAFGAALQLFFVLLAMTVLLTSVTYWASFAWYYERG